MKENKIRLDVLLVERNLAESRALAQRLVMAGQVRVAGQMITKPSVQVAEDAVITLDMGPKYVSRGGEKLEAAMLGFGLDVSGRVCADVGASTGGFTDCLLQFGAAKVYAIDVGYGQLHWRLRRDTRVIPMERTNARNLVALPEPAGCVTIDASFISLQVLLPVVWGWLVPRMGDVVALVKPQFEAGKEAVDKGSGVIQDPKVHQRVLEDTLIFAEKTGYTSCGLIRSPLRGPKGNTEFLVWLQNDTNNGCDRQVLIQNVMQLGD